MIRELPGVMTFLITAPISTERIYEIDSWSWLFRKESAQIPDTTKYSLLEKELLKIEIWREKFKKSSNISSNLKP